MFWSSLPATFFKVEPCVYLLTFSFLSFFCVPVHPRGDRLRVGGPQPVRLPAAGEPADHPRHQALRGPLLAGHLPQLPAGRLLRPEAAGPAQPHRSEPCRASGCIYFEVIFNSVQHFFFHLLIGQRI